MGITTEEEQVLFNFREQKNLIEKECQQAGIDINDVKHYWYKSKVFSMFIKQKGKTIEDLKEYLIKDLSKYTPNYPVIKRNKLKDCHCLVLDPTECTRVYLSDGSCVFAVLKYDTFKANFIDKYLPLLKSSTDNQ